MFIITKTLKRHCRGIYKKEGIGSITVRINSGRLKIGDDIMIILVVGRFRTNVLPVLETPVSEIKTRVLREEELY